MRGALYLWLLLGCAIAVGYTNRCKTDWWEYPLLVAGAPLFIGMSVGGAEDLDCIKGELDAPPS